MGVESKGTSPPERSRKTMRERIFIYKNLIAEARDPSKVNLTRSRAYFFKFLGKNA
jgi:hypothetical protein